MKKSKVEQDVVGYKSPVAKYDGRILYKMPLLNEYGANFGYEYFTKRVEDSTAVKIVVDHDDDTDPYGDVWFQTRFTPY